MSEEAIREFRIEKLQKLRELGKDPFLAERFNTPYSAKSLLERDYVRLYGHGYFLRTSPLGARLTLEIDEALIEDDCWGEDGILAPRRPLEPDDHPDLELVWLNLYFFMMQQKFGAIGPQPALAQGVELMKLLAVVSAESRRGKVVLDIDLNSIGRALPPALGGAPPEVAVQCSAEALFTERLRKPGIQSFAGRIVSLRLMGKAAFAHLSDGEGKIQVYFRKDDLAEVDWEVVGLLDIGDHIGITGPLFITRTQEKSIHALTITPLSKALVPPPIGKEKDGQIFYGLTDVDQRYRHRHLDLIANPEARKILLDRSRIVSAVRRYFDGAGYFEVETPILQVEAGGATARPFHTHYNAYEMDVKLRISLELYLKRIICGDVPRVYEIGRVFRNEGVSNRHNPEFTMLEFYEAYTDLEGMMARVEELVRYVTHEVFGTTSVGGCEFGKPWARVDLLSEIEAQCGIKPEELRDLDAGRLAMARVGLPVEAEHNLGGIIEKLLERFVEPTLQQPSFVVGYPIETSPLAKKDPNRPGITRRFEGYAFGRELCNAFSELNDPIDQRQRFEQQLAERAKGDDEAHPMDEEFIFALETGMPPTGGCGIGIDRLVMLLTGAEHLREILLFPMMKPSSRAIPD